ncbi:MAG: glycoside hydrolase family 38 C-terminal domain-containing protein [Chloroflexota bacterium]
MTNKLNIWNDTTVFPHDSFRWRGLDGSEVITHFPPTHFAQDLTADNLRRHWDEYREKLDAPTNLFIYGWGDGGGGPTREMVQTGRSASSFPGLPNGKLAFAEDFFDNLAKQSADLPVWDDELYLETHRGTLTTRADLKKKNRRAEVLYRNAEIITAFANLVGYAQNQDEINEGWKLVLLNQFHDTLPGTHVPAAIPDIERDYVKAFEIGNRVQANAIGYLAQQIAHDNADVLLFNTLGWERNELIEAPHQPGAAAIGFGNEPAVPIQHYAGQTYFRVNVPSMGWTAGKFVAESSHPTQNTATFDGHQIETERYQIHLNAQGELNQIVDKLYEREILADAARFQVFEDDPGRKFSAWDIAYHLEEYTYPVEQISPWTLKTNGPLFAVFHAAWQVLDSTIEQEMWLYADDGRMDFKTKAEWRNHCKLLKAAFPLNVRTRTAAYDLPFGHIERPTHRNTGFEQAKFEVCGHKWADLSEGDYGVAILNDCKYGYDAKENVLRISLIRSPIRPDANSDIGHHEFTYSLFPHTGGWREGQVDRAAYGLNIPSLVYQPEAQQQGASLPSTHSVLQTHAEHIIVEALKPAEDGHGLILRTFDSHGSRQKVPFETCFTLDGVAETDLLEENPVPVEHTGSQFHERFKPYEIKTHRLNF